MATEHENWVDWARQSAEAENRDLRIEWHAAIARAEAAEAALANCQHDLGTMANKVEQAEAKLVERDKPCLWTVVPDYERKYQSGCTSDWWDRKFLYCPDCGHEIVIEVGRRVAA